MKLKIQIQATPRAFSTHHWIRKDADLKIISSENIILGHYWNY
jgi:hypothetical protein